MTGIIILTLYSVCIGLFLFCPVVLPHCGAFIFPLWWNFSLYMAICQVFTGYLLIFPTSKQFLYTEKSKVFKGSSMLCRSFLPEYSRWYPLYRSAQLHKKLINRSLLHSLTICMISFFFASISSPSFIQPPEPVICQRNLHCNLRHLLWNPRSVNSQTVL